MYLYDILMVDTENSAVLIQERRYQMNCGRKMKKTQTVILRQKANP